MFQMSIGHGRFCHWGQNWGIFWHFFIFIIHLQLLLAYEFINYHRGVAHCRRKPKWPNHAFFSGMHGKRCNFATKFLWASNNYMMWKMCVHVTLHPLQPWLIARYLCIRKQFSRTQNNSLPGSPYVFHFRSRSVPHIVIPLYTSL